MGLLQENARRLHPEEQELCGLRGEIFGAFTAFVGAVDELIVVQKRLRRK